MKIYCGLKQNVIFVTNLSVKKTLKFFQKTSKTIIKEDDKNIKDIISFPGNHGMY